MSIITENKVCYWCVHENPDNLESLKDERMKGNHQKATEKYIEILLETLVWHSAKEYIAGRLFKSIEELEFLLHQLLNEGGLIIKWGRKLKNKGNAVITV
ncbi:MAG: hypothetical protein HC939_22805 [Pleurocapsa sp. SU_5_0]|nr:hypothetical protein [Pleurocapsa sp. SU_5_0]NJO95465.1 hypothetical protein [Pleurocapsa sp. CRU_1_2]